MPELVEQLRQMRAGYGAGDYIMVRPQMLDAAADVIERYHGAAHRASAEPAEIYRQALQHAAFYVRDHLQHGDEHVEIIEMLQMPSNYESGTANAPDSPGPERDKWSHELQSRLIALGEDQDDDVRNVMAEAACLLASLTSRPGGTNAQS